jgi:hypothetical protein
MSYLSQSNSVSRFNSWYARSISVLVVISLAAGFAVRAQDSNWPGLWIHGVDFKKPEKSMVFVSALSSNWRAGQEPIVGYIPLVLAPDAFRVFIDNKSVGTIQVNGFEQSEVGLDMVLAIDVSGSVYPNFEFVKAGVSAYVERRRQGKDQIAIILFGSTVKTSEFASSDKYSPFTGDVEALKQFISAQPPAEMRSRTLLFRAAADGVQTAARGRLGAGDARVQKALFLFSDGHDTGTGLDVGFPIKIAKENQIQIFCVGLPEAKTGNAHHDNLRRLAGETGGVFTTVNDLSAIQGVFERLDFLIKNEHVLSFQLPSEFADGNEHTLQIQAKNGNDTLTKGIKIRAPFIPPPPPPPPLPPWKIILYVVGSVMLFVIVVLGLAFSRMISVGRARKRNVG